MYVHTKSPHIKPPSNATILLLTGFTSNAHTKLKSYSPSFVCHTHQIPSFKTPSHTHNQTQKTPHTHQQTKPTNQDQPTPPHTFPITTNNINIIQLNINSITRKTTELTHLIHKKIHIITLQESNLNYKHKTSHIPNFSAIRLDRPSFQKGGLLTYINNNITYSQISPPTNLIINKIELLTIKIQTTSFSTKTLPPDYHSTQINNPPPSTSQQQTPQYQPTSLGKHLKPWTPTISPFLSHSKTNMKYAQLNPSELLPTTGKPTGSNTPRT